MVSSLDRLFAEIVEQAAEKAAKMVLEQLEGTQKPDRVMDVKEAAQHMGLSKKLIYQMCSEGALPHIRAGGLHSTKPRILFRQSTLGRWLREQEEANVREVS